MITERFTQGHHVTMIEPDAYTANTYTTGWLSMAEYHAAVLLVLAGTLGSSATLDAKIEQAKDSAGAGAKDITGKGITQLTQAGTDSDKMVAVELLAEELDTANKYDHIRGSLTVGTATSDAGLLLIRREPRFRPVPLTGWDEIKA